MKYAFIDRHREQHCIMNLCRALGVSRCGYYAWRNREPSQRVQADVVLLKEIRAIHQQYRHVCGSDKTCGC